MAIAQLGHLAFRRLWWGGLILGLGLTLVLVLRGAASRERAFLGIFGLASVCWGAVGWRFGIGLVQLGLLALLTAVSAIWWRRYRVRSRIDFLGMSVRLVPVGEWWRVRHVRPVLGVRVRTWARDMAPGWPPHVPAHVRTWWADYSYRRKAWRELGRIINNWSGIARDAGLPRGSRARRATADKVSYVLYITMPRGRPQRSALKLEDAFESAFDAIPGTVRVELEADRARHVRIRWMHEDPRKAGMLPWDPALVITSIRDRIKLGLYKDGRECAICMADTLHTLVCGTTQWGKTSIVKVIVASLAAARDAVVIVMDPKGAQRTDGLVGGMFSELRPTINHLIGLRDAEAVIRGLRRVMVERKSVLADSSFKTWDPTLGPYIVVVLDEFQDLPLRVKELVLKLAQKCLFVGIRLVVVTQEPNLAALGRSTALRGALARRICFMLQTSITRDIFGYEAEDRGWRPGTLRRKGDFYLSGDALNVPIEIQAMNPADADLQLVGETYSPSNLDVRSQRAFVTASMPEVDEDELLAAQDERPEGSDTRPSVVPLPNRIPPPPAAAGPWAKQDERPLWALMMEIITEAAPEPLHGRQIQERAGKGPDGKDRLKANFLYDRHPVNGVRGTGGALREAARRGLIEHTAEGWIYVASESNQAAEH